MASLIEMVKFEEMCPPNTIRLIKHGEFYRAYNHSAWLFQCCITDYKVVRKFVKQLNKDVYYIGFPDKSLLTNIGKHESKSTDFGFDISLSDDELPDEAGFETWKESVVAMQASKSDYFALPLSGSEAEREVIKRIKEYPLESKSMVECAVFLSELRKLLTNF
ncbi:MAG: hypothetical protein ACI304_06735 [Lepagella sp.]